MLGKVASQSFEDSMQQQGQGMQGLIKEMQGLREPTEET
jgi:hypothetical protein